MQSGDSGSNRGVMEERALCHRRMDCGGSDGVDANAFVGILDRGRLCDADHTMFAGVVRGPTRPPTKPATEAIFTMAPLDIYDVWRFVLHATAVRLNELSRARAQALARAAG